MKQLVAYAIFVWFLSTVNVFGQTSADSLKSMILTPTAPESPRINGAKVFGVRPGSHFYFV